MVTRVSVVLPARQKRAEQPSSGVRADDKSLTKSLFFLMLNEVSDTTTGDLASSQSVTCVVHR